MIIKFTTEAIANLKNEEQRHKLYTVKDGWDYFEKIHEAVSLTYEIIDGCLDNITVKHLESNCEINYSVACNSVSATFRDTCKAIIKLSEKVA